MDLNEEAIKICRLSLWITTAARGKVLTSLDRTIRVGNSIVADPTLHPRAFDWEADFPEVFERGGFDAVIGKPWRQAVRAQGSNWSWGILGLYHNPKLKRGAITQSLAYASGYDRKKVVTIFLQNAPRLSYCLSPALESAQISEKAS